MLYQTLLLRNFNFKMGEAPGDRLMISRRVTVGSGNVAAVELGDILRPGAPVQYMLLRDGIVGDANGGTPTQMDVVGTNTAIPDGNATLVVLANVDDLAQSPVSLEVLPLMPAMQ